LTKRIDLRAANKKAIENLILAGGFDSFVGTTRAQYLHTDSDGVPFYEKAIRFAAKFQENENSSQVSLFGETSEVVISEPIIPTCEDWTTMEKLAREREVVGIYISGHPLDDYKFEMKHFCNSKLEMLKNMNNHLNKTLSFGGIVSNAQHRIAKNGKGWAVFNFEGYDESYEFRIFGEEYLKYKHFLTQNSFTYVKLTIKEGWADRETGKKGDPRIQFIEFKVLQNVLDEMAKKLNVLLDVNLINPDFIDRLNTVFTTHKGESFVSFDVLETQKVKKIAEVSATVEPDNSPNFDALLIETDPENSEDDETVFTEIITDEDDAQPLQAAPVVDTSVEETRVITRLWMQSRKLKVKISNDLLNDLEQLQVDFKLN
jgi:DNA polymerase III subunit alpha